MAYRYKRVNKKRNYEWLIVVLAITMIFIVGYDIVNVVRGLRDNCVQVNSVNQVVQNHSKGGFKENFKDDVFLGDSITKGLSSYNVLDERNVYAKVGINIRGVEDEVDKVEGLTPKRIFIMCGINDMDDTLTTERFTNNYSKLIDKVKQRFPASKVFVQSILPVLPAVEEKKPYMKRNCINKYNNIIKEVAKNKSIAYIDTESILNEDNRDLYASDGIHFKIDFYTVWLNYLLENAK